MTVDPSRTKAILVGIEQYDEGAHWNLNGPVRDAVDFGGILAAKNVPPENIRFFLAPLQKNAFRLDHAKAIGSVSPTPTEAVLHDLFAKELIGENCDLLVIYWSGHGFIAGKGRHRRLFTCDATAQNKTQIDFDSLRAALETDRYPDIERIDFIVDACANHVAVKVDELEYHPFRSGKVVPDREQRVLCAAAPGHFARNLNADSTGVFTRELLDILIKEAAQQWPIDFTAAADKIKARLKSLDPAGKARNAAVPALILVNAGGTEWVDDLPGDDRRDEFFSRLGVFADGFTFNACRAVCLDYDILTTEIFLRELEEAGMLEVSATRPRRYRLSEESHPAAIHRLALLEQDELARTRHAQYLAGLAEEVEPWLRSAQRQASMMLLQSEAKNIAAALNWCAETPELAGTGLRLAGALAWFWIVNGRFEEGRQQMEPLFKAGALQQDATVRAKALYADGALAFMLGLYHAAAERLSAAERIFSRAAATPERARNFGYTLVALGRVLPASTRRDKIFTRACTQFRNAGDDWGRALAFNDQGYVEATLGKWDAARKCLANSESRWRKLGDRWGLSLSLNNRGMVEAHEGNLAEARKAHEEALCLYLEDGNDWGIAESLKLLGEVELEDGNFQTAEAAFRESLRRLQIEPRLQLQVDCMLGLARTLARPQSPASDQQALAARLLGKWDRETRLLKLVPPPGHVKFADTLEKRLRGLLGDRFATEFANGAATDADRLLEPWLPAEACLRP